MNDTIKKNKESKRPYCQMILSLIFLGSTMPTAISQAKGLEPAVVVAESKVKDCYQSLKKSNKMVSVKLNSTAMQKTNLPNSGSFQFSDHEERTFDHQCLKLAYQEIQGLRSAPEVQAQLLELVKQQEEQTRYLDFYVSVLPFNPSFCQLLDSEKVFQANQFESPHRQPSQHRQWLDDLANGCLNGPKFTEQLKKMSQNNQAIKDQLCQQQDFKSQLELCSDKK